MTDEPTEPATFGDHLAAELSKVNDDTVLMGDIHGVGDDIGHHPELVDDYNRHDYIAVDGQTLVAEFKFDDGSGIKAWTRDQGQLYATRHLAGGRALLLSGQARVDVDAVNAEIHSLAQDHQGSTDD